MQCGTCDRFKRKVICSECAQSTIWPLRTDFLFKTADRDAASERVNEYLEQAGDTPARCEQLRERILQIDEEAARLRESIKSGTYPTHFAGCGCAPRLLTTGAAQTERA